MTLQEIDAALAAWGDRLAVVAENLLHLQADPTYQLLTGTGGCAQVKLTGVTAARVEPALAAVPAVFEQFALLQSTVERAAKMRSGLHTFFGSETRLREVENLLCGQTIAVAEADVQVDQRMLLTGPPSARRVRPEELLELMTQAFARARNAVTEVGHAWQTLAGALGQTERRILQLEDRLTRAGGPRWPTLQTALQRLSAVREQVQADPLGASAALNTQVAPLLAEANARAEAAEQTTRGLQDAGRRLDALAVLHQEALAAAAEAQRKVENVAGLPAPVAEAKLQGLRDWLGRLEHKAAQGMLEAVRIGLQNWNSMAETFVQQEESSIAAHRAAIGTRRELRGRLDALKAKARVYGVAEMADFTTCATEAETVLYRRPTDTRRAEAAVASYERLLRNVKREPKAL